jgi:acetyl esterase/lipase
VKPISPLWQSLTNLLSHDQHPHVFYGTVLLLACSWPVWIVAAILSFPFVSTMMLCRGAANICRAVDWNLFRGLKLLAAVASHLWGIASMIPLMLTVYWYYYVRAAADGVVRNIPFATCPWASSPNSGAGSGMSGFSTPNRTPSSASLKPPSAPPTPGSGSAAQPLQGGQGLPLFPRIPPASTGALGLSGTGEIHIANSRLDVYRHPQETTGPVGQSSGSALRPVIVFIYGGAWSTGSKVYYSKFAAMLRTASDAVVVVPDYPLYPTAWMSTMIDSLYHVLRWVQGNIERYGGDPRQIHLVGHSAGAHLAAMLILRRAMALSNDLPCPLPAPCTSFHPVRQPIPIFGSVKSIPPPPYSTPTTGHGPSSSQFASGASTPKNAAGATQPLSRLDYRHCPAIHSFTGFCGVYDIREHFNFEYQRAVERVSSMEAATGGYWHAFSPTVILNSIQGSPCPSAGPSTPNSKPFSGPTFDTHAGVKGNTPPSEPHPAEEKAASKAKSNFAATIHAPPHPSSTRLALDPRHMPYMVLVHAAADSVVAPRQSLELEEALQRHGVACPDVQLVEGAHSDVIFAPLIHQGRTGSALHHSIVRIIQAMQL